MIMEENIEELQRYVPNVHFEQIPIKNLVSDQNYQRNLSLRHVEKAAANFDLYQINPVKVSRRNGINYVFNGQHTIEIVVDRLVVKEGIRSRLTDSLETVFSLTGSLAAVEIMGKETWLFSQKYACPEHNISIEELTPRMFSFNNPYGACENCTGLGVFQKVDPDLIVPNVDLSIAQGAIKAPGWNSLDDNSIAMMYYQAVAESEHVSLDTPVKDLPDHAMKSFLYGTTKELFLHRIQENGKSTGYRAAFEGVIPNLERRAREGSEWA